MAKLKIVGLDLSITATGICDADGVMNTVGGDAKIGDHRLIKIRDAVRPVAEDADLVLIELLPQHMKAAGITAMVHGVVRVLLIELGVPYTTITPGTLKTYATGRGTATKSDMRIALYQRFGIDERDDNRADAWWLRALGLDLYGEPLTQLNGSTKMPETHRRALKVLTVIDPRETL